MSESHSGETPQELWRENPERWLSTHESAALSLSVGPDGRLATVRLTRQWYRTLKPEEFGAAVLQTKRESAAVRMQELEERRGEPGAGEEGAGPTDGQERTPEGDWAQLESRMSDLRQAFDQLRTYRESAMSAAREEATLTSPSGRLKLNLRGGTPQSLLLDSYAVELVSEAELAEELIALFARAETWLEEQREEALHELPELAAIYRARR